MKLILTSTLDPWNNKYSVCAFEGAIMNYIKSLPGDSKVCLLFGDGICNINYKS